MVNRQRLEFLDALRGIAALWVVIYHVARVPKPHLEAPDWLWWVVHNGGSGVQLFFVVSAFSLCYTMPRHLAQSSPMMSFYLSRFFRIAPLFYVMLAFLIFRQVVYFEYLAPAPIILANLTFIFNFIPGWQTGMVAASWTIGVEMVFYLVFPAVYFLSNTPKRAMVFVSFSIALIFVMKPFLLAWLGAKSGDYITYSITSHLMTFAWGILAFWAFPVLHASPRRNSIAAGLLVATPIIFVVVAAGLAPLHKVFWMGPMFVAVLLGLSILPIRLAVNRATRWAGKNSYSIYLLHPVAIVFLTPFFRWVYGLGLPTTYSFGLCVVATLAVVLPLSEFTYRLIERPVERLGKWIVNRTPSAIAPPPIRPTESA